MCIASSHFVLTVIKDVSGLILTDKFKFVKHTVDKIKCRNQLHTGRKSHPITNIITCIITCWRFHMVIK